MNFYNTLLEISTTNKYTKAHGVAWRKSSNTTWLLLPQRSCAILATVGKEKYRVQRLKIAIAEGIERKEDGKDHCKLSSVEIRSSHQKKVGRSDTVRLESR